MVGPTSPIKRLCYTAPKKRRRPLAQLLSAQAIGVEGPGFKSRVGQIGTVSPAARHLCDVSSELCSPGDKLQRWAPPLVTRFDVIPRVK